MKPRNSISSIKSIDTLESEELEILKDEVKFPNRKTMSPRSSLTCCDAELILTSLNYKILMLMKECHKEFNPIAQGTPFYLRKKPNGEMIDYLSYLNFTTLNSNFYV